MKIINESETISWLEKRGFALSDGKPSLDGYPATTRIPIPVDTGKKTGLAKSIISLFDGSPETMLWIDEFGIWTSCEHMDLFYGYRRSLGEDAHLFDKPGHIFSGEDKETAI